MASPAGFSVERLQRFGSEAVRKERRKQQINHAVTLSCEYLGVAAGEDRFDPALAAQASLHVGFAWRVTTNVYEHSRNVPVRCDNLAARGVPFPPGWKVALQYLDLDEIVNDTVKRVVDQSGSPGVRCQLE